MRAAWLLLLLPTSTLAQTGLSGRVVDKDSGVPLSYCSVVLLGEGTGTLTNEEGAFAFPERATGDSIVCTMVGYARRTVGVRDVLIQPEIGLASLAIDLRPVEVTPDQEHLYQLVVRCAARMRKMPSFSTKLYFEMDTRMDDRPVEVVECYYNSRVDGPQVRTLDLKQGRIGIAPVDNRFFVSLNVTKAMMLLDIRQYDQRFPASPFEWRNTNALMKHYRVEERGRALDGSGLVHMVLTARDSSGTHFDADIWIDGTTAMPRSIALACARCKRHPFLPLKPEDRIGTVDLRVNITFDDGPEPQLQHMELAYALDYTDTTSTHVVRTKAVMHTFDHGTSFLLPMFEYDKEQYDYRKITFQPYDSTFWAMAPTLVRTSQQEHDRAFFAEHGFLTGSKRMPELEGQPFFESNYALWGKDKRISMKTLPLTRRPSDPDYESIQGKGRSSQVHLEAQLYMDVDTAGSAPRIFTATVFDGFRSFHLPPPARYTNAFLNLYFDLCEIERRRMDERLRTPGLNYGDMRAIHARAVRDMQRVTGQYLKEVDLGANGLGMTKWNAVVLSALGIDNMKLAGLGEDGEGR